MKSVFASLLAATLFSFGVTPQALAAVVSFRGLPPASTVKESRETYEARRERIIRGFLGVVPPAPPSYENGDLQHWGPSLIARLVYRTDLETVNARLLDPEFVPWNTGTGMDITKHICHRKGDYDFYLQSLIQMAYVDDEAGRTLLSPEARDRLLHVLLNERGTEHHIKFKFEDCIGLKIKESENHILTIEVARYLTNQLLFDESVRAGQPNAAYDNSKNGFDEWMLNHLSQFLKTDFSEFNSRPYQGYALIGLGNLYGWTRSTRVKTMVQSLLDYLVAKTSVQQAGLQRYAPYRRQKDWRDIDLLQWYDNTPYWLLPVTGNYSYLQLYPGNEVNLDFLSWEESSYTSFMAAMTGYRAPDVVLDLYFDRSTPLFQRLNHRKDVEIDEASTSFVLSGGGRFRSVFGYLTGQNDVWGVASLVLPAHYGLKKSELFRFEGAPNWHQKNNTCLVDGFMCGEGLQIPAAADACRRDVSGWSFYDMKNCPSAPMGFYVAILRSKTGREVAMMEVREPDIAFDSFVSGVIAKNPSLSIAAGRVSSYETTRGHRIDFTPGLRNLKLWPILKIDGVAQETRYDRWPMARGSVITSDGDGLMVITHPAHTEKLVIDIRDPLNPKRTQIENSSHGLSM